MGNHRIEVHHSVARSRGGGDDEWNLHELSEYEHAYEHALNFVLFEHAPQFDFRMNGWKLLPQDLQEACSKEHGRRNRASRPLPPKTREFQQKSLAAAIAKDPLHQAKAGKIGGERGGPKGIRNTTSQKWMSLVDGFISNPGNVARHNKSIGADPNLKVRVY
jgi:hypothetical protein